MNSWLFLRQPGGSLRFLTNNLPKNIAQLSTASDEEEKKEKKSSSRKEKKEHDKSKSHELGARRG